MQFTSANRSGSPSGSGDLDSLVRQIARLVRHPAYRRNRVVSPLLLRHLPFDHGYAWQGEASLLDRLTKAKLDGASVQHLMGSVQSEYTRLRGPVDA
ncbi:hypothetical protein [Methylobacterium sp. J-067]|uniref:hypothetical protein n=1 Tax=Methylobacterium sp. J-067 TaxID=2836648 RepID=UPI001FB9D359|nr:hypothetical protein [Methylobacterium sp. J-067]MCJ2026899.1 hypothetical protein [Methylobacterium sp. J-067]